MQIEILLEYILQEIDGSARFYKKNIIYHPNVKKIVLTIVILLLICC
jgi:hypothetical protein